MSLWQTMRVALRALMRNKMRSFLTTLGIIIGVAAVITMVSLGEGAKAQLEAQFASMGSNLLMILPGATTAGGSRGGFGSASTLTWDDLKAIQNDIPSVRLAAPVLRTNASVLSEDQNWTTSIQGITPEYLEIRGWDVSKGTRFTQSDIEAGNKLCILGETVVEKLYGANADPVGQQVRIKNIPFVVGGVLVKKGQSPTGQDYDDTVLIPVSTFGGKIQGGLKNYINGIIMVGAVSQEATSRAEKEISALLRDRHHIQPGAEDDFSVRNLTETASAQQEGMKTMTLLLACVAAVSLLVGGIGIMNIMLVSVTERTREIGLRMAVGAKSQQILTQFLVEALVLSTLGGLIGVTLGLVGGAVVAEWLHWPVLNRPDVIVIAVGFSALVGIGFGLYPARKASQLDPIDALRYE
jgi:putative ABC transport system permease protein